MEFIGLIVSIVGVALVQRFAQRQRTSRRDDEVEDEANSNLLPGELDIGEDFDAYYTPSKQSRNRTEQCLRMGYFSSAQEARKNVGRPINSSRVDSLNGLWQFKLFSDVQSALTELSNPALDKFQHVVVPGNWQLQVPGDSPIYTNFKYIIPVDPPNVPVRNTTGYHRREFQLQSHLRAEHDVYLSFGAVDSFFYLWVNRRYVGFSKDSRLAADFNITSYLRQQDTSAGEDDDTVETCVVELLVLRYSDGHYLEDQDMWNLSGLFRDVSVYYAPAAMVISDYSWQCEVNERMKTAQVEVNVQVTETFPSQRARNGGSERWETGNAALAQFYAVQVQLFQEGCLVTSTYSPVSAHGTNGGAFDPACNPPQPEFLFENSRNDAPICTASTPIKSHRPAQELWELNIEGASVTHNQRFVLPVPQGKFHLWSAERPYVYTLTVTLLRLHEGNAITVYSGIR
jgi:beta-galactosidase/beta-glucuronidase